MAKIGNQYFLEIPRFNIKTRYKGSGAQRVYGKLGCVLMVKGNQLSKAENLTKDQNDRRILGLYKTWDVHRRKRNGEKVVTNKMKKRKKQRLRLRLKVTVAKEAREIVDLCRTHAVAGVDRMAKIINDPNSQDSVAVAAFLAITERAYGKASQTNLNAHVNLDGKANEITDRELDQRITEALKRVEDLTERKKSKAASPPQLIDLRKLN